MAHKLARLVYRLLKFGHEYVDKGLQYYEQKYRDQQIALLQKKASASDCNSQHYRPPTEVSGEVNLSVPE
jgi:hypothetical protein